MFRVLSEEESKRVTRWKAPDLGGSAASVASTRDQTSPDHELDDKQVTPLLGSSALKRIAIGDSAKPKLDIIRPVNVFDTEATALLAGSADVQDIPLVTVSAELLQASYDEGYAKGLADVTQALNSEKLQELSKVIQSAQQAVKNNHDAQLEEEVLGLSMDIARLVVRHELSVNPQAIAQLVKSGLQQLHSHQISAPCVHLNPEDARAVREHAALPSDITLLDDPTLERGACRIESGASVLDAGMDDWLQRVATDLGLPAANADSAAEAVSEVLPGALPTDPLKPAG